MASQARILDLQAGTVMKLGQSRIASVIGLSPVGELLCTTGECLDVPDMVQELCRIKHKADGDWLIPSPYLMTSVNDSAARGHVLLKHGSVINVGGRYMRYSLNNADGCAPSRNLTSSHMNACENLTSLHVLTASTTFDPATVYASMTSLGNNASTDSDGVLAPDPELLQFLQTNDGLAHMTAAIVSQHVIMYTSLKMSAADIDRLFLSFEHVTSWEDACFNTFLCEYEQLFTNQDSADPTGRQVLDQSGPTSIHSPVIHLLTSLLKLSLDPVQYTVLWLRLLVVLSKCTKSLTPLVEYKTSGAVLGCMTAKHDVSVIQEHGCYILSRIACYKPAPTEKGPLREGAIQIVLDALKRHKSVVRVTKNGVRFLGNLTQTYARLAMDVVNTLQYIRLDEQRDTLIEVMKMLNFVEQEVVPVLRELLNGDIKDEHCRTQIKKIMSYFEENAHEDQTDDSHGADSTAPELQREEKDHDLQLEDHFNQTQDISEAVARLSCRPITRKHDNVELRHVNENEPENMPADSSPNKVLTQRNNQVNAFRDGISNRNGHVTVPRSSEGKITSREGGDPEKGNSSGQTRATPVKSKPGMLAFAVVRSTKKAKEKDEATEENDISPSREQATSGQSVTESIISGVEFFSDEEDGSNSRSRSKRSNNVDGEAVNGNLLESGYEARQSFGNEDASRDSVPDYRPIPTRNEKRFVSEAALDAGSLPSRIPNTTTHANNAIRKKRTNLFDKLTWRTKGKLKKRFSILSTEYKQTAHEPVRLSSSSLLEDCLRRARYDFTSDHVDVQPSNLGTDGTTKRVNNGVSNGVSNAVSNGASNAVSTGVSNGVNSAVSNGVSNGISKSALGGVSNCLTNGKADMGSETRSGSPGIPKSDAEPGKRPFETVPAGSSLDLGSNVLRYVNIFCSMSRKGAVRETASDTSSTDSGGQRKPTSTPGQQAVAEFIRKATKLFQEARGRYDFDESAIRLSLSQRNISGLSYIPLGMEGYGHDCSLRDSLTCGQRL